MGVDPLDYDVDELRSATEGAVPPTYDVKEAGFHWASSSEGRRTGPEDPTPEQARRVAALGGVDPERLHEKPFLPSVPEGERAREAVLDWLGYLAAEAGYEGALAALERYDALDWFGDGVEEELRGYMLGVGRPEGDGLAALDATDHLLSFAYVARLSSVQ
jgi:archaellum component FlaD/FlaE